MDHTSVLRRTWTYDEFVAWLPPSPIDILDIGADPKPFAARDGDRLTTVDFAETFSPDVVADVAVW